MSYEDILVRQENLIGPGIHKRSLNTSVWHKLVPKTTWPKGLSDSIQVLTVERNLPANIDTWADVTADNVADSCAPTADVVPAGQTLRSFNLAVKALESDEICVEATRNAFQVSEQIRLMFENLTNVVRYTWKRRHIAEYTRISEHKVVAAPGLPEASSHMPTIAPTSILTQGILNKIYNILISDSAEMDGGSIGMSDGRPQFILVTDMESSDAIMRESGNVNSFLWNSKRVPELLAPLGVERGFRGFYHTIEVLPPRFDFVDDEWVEIEPYVQVAASKGTKAKLNPAYIAAPYQDSFVFLPTVMSCAVPEPISTVGSKTQFDPVAYMGDFKWKNIIDRATNPDGTIGFYRAILKAGYKPVQPAFGWVIRHLRCPSDIGAQACPASTDGASSDLESGESFLVS
jgi:hypothetical protein